MRNSKIHRKTRETDIKVDLDLDGTGQSAIQTGIDFFDHMLNHLALHGFFDLEIEAQGDLEVDAHHTIEDCALALGQAFNEALGERSGITRMGSAYVPMDEALALVVVDLSGRPYCVFQAEWHGAMIGQMPVSMVKHFFSSLAVTMRANVHGQLLRSEDDHHGAEALFKALGRALGDSCRKHSRREDSIPSTKGTL